MIAVPRETISQALFGLFTPYQISQGSDPTSQQPFVTCSRLYPDGANVDVAAKPALFLVERDENDDQSNPFGLEKYVLNYWVVVFANVPQDGTTAPGSVLNPLVDTVDGAIRGVATNFQTLSTAGIINVWINPHVRKWAAAGALSQCAAMFDIAVLTGE